jgi:hypothetical protein
MGYYGWPTVNEDIILAVSPEDGTSSDAKQVPEGDDVRHRNEEMQLSIKASALTQLTNMEGGNKPDNETASLEKEAEESSSIEPTWGRIESSKERERMEDLIKWESINVGGYASQRTTKAYRHGRCYMCSKPVSSTNLDPNLELFCKECDEELITLCERYRKREQDMR